MNITNGFHSNAGAVPKLMHMMTAQLKNTATLIPFSVEISARYSQRTLPSAISKKNVNIITMVISSAEMEMAIATAVPAIVAA